MTDVETGEGRTPAPWRIIGIGSPVVGDDLGWRAIEALREAGMGRHAELLSLDRPGTVLLDYLDPDGRVILIDAMEAGLFPGNIRELELDDLISNALAPSSHDFGVAETLALAQAVGSLPQCLHLLGLQMPAGPVGENWFAAVEGNLIPKVRSILGILAHG